MKLIPWLLSALAPLTALSLLAQPTNPAPVPAPSAAPTTEVAPAKPKTKAKAKAKAKHHPKRVEPAKPAPIAKNTITLTPPVMAMVKDDILNVRGQPSFVGEVIGHLKKGDTVMVLEEISRSSSSKDEPAHWDRIVMPTNGSVWVDAALIDAEKNVRARKVNLRGGPGENYSIVGQLEKGTSIKEIRAEKGWLRIEAPTNAYAFVAAEYLEAAPQLASASAPEIGSPPATTPAPAPQPEVVNVPREAAPVPAQEAPVVAAPTPAPAPAPIAAPAPVAPAPTPQSEVDQELAALRKATIPDASPAAAGTTSTATPAPAPASGIEIAPRVVTREGFVHRAYNIQAPADFELHDIKTGVLIDYLQPSTKNFKIYVGTRVTVTGTEALDERWPRTPILRIQTVDLMP